MTSYSFIVDEDFNNKRIDQVVANQYPKISRTKVNKNIKKISDRGIETEKKVAESALEFARRNETLETEVNKKLKHAEEQLKNVEEQVENQIGYLNTSLRGHIVSIETDQKEKINGIEKLLKNNTKSLSHANKALKDRLQELNRSLLLEISSITQKFTSSNDVFLEF